jgi:hypothetical protein
MNLPSGKPLCTVEINVDNIPGYVQTEIFLSAQRTLLRYMVAEAMTGSPQTG